jgi:hypothetical protein
MILSRESCPQVCHACSPRSNSSDLRFPLSLQDFASEGNIAVSHDEALALLSVRKQAVTTYGAPEIQMDRE